MKIKSFLLLTFLCTSFLTSISQEAGKDFRHVFIAGLQGGFSSSKIEGLKSTILSEPYFINYIYQEPARKGYTVGAFINYKGFGDDESSTPSYWGGVQFEIAYAQQGGDFLLNNTQADFNYKMQFKYQYVNLNIIFKGYPIKYSSFLGGINLGVGFQGGLGIANQNIIYTSGGSGRPPAFGSDLEQQQQLRNVLKGKSKIGLIGNVGYEFKNFPILKLLTIDFKYYYGLSDVLETQANSYNFIETDNKSRCWQITLGYVFPLWENL